MTGAVPAAENPERIAGMRQKARPAKYGLVTLYYRILRQLGGRFRNIIETLRVVRHKESRARAKKKKKKSIYKNSASGKRNDLTHFDRSYVSFSRGGPVRSSTDLDAALVYNINADVMQAIET